MLADLLPWLVLVAVALAASTLAAVAGFGGAVVLLPVAQLVGNLSRVGFNRRELDWPVVGWFALST